MNRFTLQNLSTQLANALIGCVWFFLFVFNVQANPPTNSVNQQIDQAIQLYVTDLLKQRFQEFSVDIQPIDSRLNLSVCGNAINVQHRPSNRVSGRLTMKVSCNGPTPWRIHVPVKVQAFDTVVISSSPIAKGTHLSSADMKLELRDVSLLHKGYFSSIEQAVGFVAKRPIAAEQVLNALSLKPPQLIEKGERVVITAEGSGLSVRTTGIAMEKGALGELIRIRNTKTNKVVEGRITGPGHIKVHL